jgi:hypothetical protein
MRGEGGVVWKGFLRRGEGSFRGRGVCEYFWGMRWGTDGWDGYADRFAPGRGGEID